MEDRLRMHPLVRGFAGWMAFQAVAAAMAILLLPGAVGLLLGMPCGFFAARALWRIPSTTAGDLLHATGTGAAVIGGLALIAGMVAPMMLAPHSHIGPLIGILYTGPIGAGIGALAGASRWMLRWSSAT